MSVIERQAALAAGRTDTSAIGLDRRIFFTGSEEFIVREVEVFEITDKMICLNQCCLPPMRSADKAGSFSLYRFDDSLSQIHQRLSSMFTMFVVL
jgi:hypothetical protein